MLAIVSHVTRPSLTGQTLNPGTEREIQLRESFLLSQHACLNDDEISHINESGTGRHTLICIRIDQGCYGYTHSVTCLHMPSVKNPDQYKQVSYESLPRLIIS